MGARIRQAGVDGRGCWLLPQLSSDDNKACNINLCAFDAERMCRKQAELEEEELSRRRMVELMLGPCNYWCSNVTVKQGTPCDTLDLLKAPMPLLDEDKASLQHPPSAMEYTPVELEPDSPLPSGWEKCLDLKTGCIYYLNRNKGLNSTKDPRKSLAHHNHINKSGIGMKSNLWSASATTAELMTEASAVTMEASVKSNEKVVFNVTADHGGEDREDMLDLNLSLNVGNFTSKAPPAPVSASAGACPSLYPWRSKAPSTLPSASSSSSSTSSPSLHPGVPFSNGSLSSMEARPSPSRDVSSTVVRQDSNPFPLQPLSKERPGGGGFLKYENTVCWDNGLLPTRETSTLSDCNGHAAGDINASSAMVTLACANCLMFVMLSRSNPRCPKCGTRPDQLEFLQPSVKRIKLGLSV